MAKDEKLICLAKDLLSIAERSPHNRRAGVLQVAMRTLLLAKKEGAPLGELLAPWGRLKDLARPLTSKALA